MEPQTKRLPFQEFCPSQDENRQGLAPPSTPLPDFLISAENAMLEAAFADLILASDTRRFNPVVLHGPTGTGKTHLLLGFVNIFDQQMTFGTGLLTTGADWSRSYAQAVEDKELEVWRDKCRRAAYLVLDDLESLHRKFAAQRELVILLDDLVSRQVPCLLAGRSNPLSAAELIPELSGRLAAGLTIPLHPPDLGTRREFLRQLAVDSGLEITEPGIQFLADQFAGTITETKSAFVQLAHKLPLDRKIDVLQLRRMLREQVPVDGDVPLSSIVAAVARYFQLNKAKLLGTTRRRSIVHARCIAIYLSRQLSGATLKGIGTFFGGRDHTTILHSYRKIELEMESDATTRLAVEAITSQLTKGRV